MTEELKPCPFCGDPNIVITRVGFHAVSMATCCGCGADGPARVSDEAAISAWNTRAPLAVTEEMIKRAAVAISGAPFPSKRSMDKARLVLAALESGA